MVHGDIVFVSGPVADKAAGKSVGEQTTEILAIIDEMPRQCRHRQDEDPVGENIWLVDIKTFAEMNAVWDAWVAQGHTSARATVEAKLAAPQFAVEIACVAERIGMGVGGGGGGVGCDWGGWGGAK